MQGKISVYKGFCEELLCEESNLIVDGFKEHIVDLLTRFPSPSSIFGEVSAAYEVSNFAPQAISLSPPRSSFLRQHSLGAASGYVLPTGSTSTVFSSFDPSDGNSWVYLEDITNHVFSAVNSPSSTIYKNSVLSNPTFSATIPVTINNSFREYSLDNNLSGFFMNEVLGLYELNGWTIKSYLRYNPSSVEYIDSYPAGSCARLNIEDVSSIYSMVSGTEPLSITSQKGDGVLYIRSFAPSSNPDSSGAVSLSQHFSIYKPEMSNMVSYASASVLAEVTAQFSSVSGTSPGAVIHVNIFDETDGEGYNFSANSSYTRNSWGGSGYPLVIPAEANVSGTISKFFNVPNSKVSNTLKVSFEFYSESSSAPLGCYFWNAGITLLDGWYFGNIYENGDIQRVVNNDFKDAGLFISCSSIGLAPYNTPLSSTTFLSQNVRLNPLKKYSFNVFPRRNDNLASSDRLHQALVKWSSSNIRESFKYNYLSQISASSLVETKLGDLYAVSPELPQSSKFEPYEQYSESISPSTLCLEVPKQSTLSASVEIEPDRVAVFRGDVLRFFESGVSAGNLEFFIYTKDYDEDGNRRFFNFVEGTWDAASSINSILDSSSVYADSGFGSFVSRQLNLALLNNKIDIPKNGLYSLIVEIQNNNSEPVFVKNLRLDSSPPTSDEVEIFRYTGTSSVEEKWEHLSLSAGRDYIFSGLSPDFLYQKLSPNNSDVNRNGVIPIESMYASMYSNHSSESEYEVFIFNSTINSASEFVKIDAAYLVDSALVVATEEIEDNIFTSEDYYPFPRFDVIRQPVGVWWNSESLYNSTRYISPGLGVLNSPVPLAEFDVSSGVCVGSAENPNGSLASPSVKLGYTFPLSDLNFPTSSTGFAFSFDYNQEDADSNGKPFCAWQVAAKTKDGRCVWWNSSTSSWELISDSIPANPYKTIVAKGTTGTLNNKIKTAFTTPIDVFSHDFDPSSLITCYISLGGFKSSDAHYMRNWRFFLVTEPSKFDLPEFPTPVDKTVQTPDTPTAKLGQFTNYIQYESDLSGVTVERALGTINWAPKLTTSSLYISGSSFDGFGNKYAFVNSDGFILENYNGFDALGLALKGWVQTVTPSSLVYTLDIEKNDIDFFEFQGGIGAIGLWAFDVDKTLKKLKDNGHSLSSIYDTTPPWSNGLYTLNDESRNPIFRLISKKVFRTPLMYEKPAPKIPVFRFVWEIRLI